MMRAMLRSLPCGRRFRAGLAPLPGVCRRLPPAAASALLLAALATCGSSPAACAGLTATERRIAAAVDPAIPAALALLERAVNVNSGTMNFAGVREAGGIFGAELEPLGFQTRWVDGAPFGRAGHLVATRPGRNARIRVLLIGHLDTVFERDSPFQRWERLSDFTARGPGAVDMKGGNVVMLVALRSLREAGLLDRLALTVVLTGDEEKAGSPLALARRDLIEAARWADVALGFEDGDGDPTTAVVARRGSTSWRLRVGGRAAHSSQIFRPDVGSGAIYESARILSAFHDSLRGEQYLTANPGVTLGGTTVSFDPQEARGTAFGKTNVIAESTVVSGDLRALSLAQRERAKERMQRIVAAHLPHTGATLEFADSYPPLALSEGNQRLLQIFDRVSRDLGYGPVGADDPARAGAADVSFCEGLVDMAMDGLGLMGEGGHTVQETADLRTLPMNAKRVAVLLARLASGDRAAR
jgi:glutamate carboxypeptidase